MSKSESCSTECQHATANSKKPVGKKFGCSLVLPDHLRPFSVDAGVFIVYTSFDGDKSRIELKAVSFPRFENLLHDLDLMIDDQIRNWSKDYLLQVRHIPYPSDTPTDESDTMFLRLMSKDKEKNEETTMTISICVLPNSQNIEPKLHNPYHDQGLPLLVPLKIYNEDFYENAREHIYEYFLKKYGSYPEKVVENLGLEDDVDRAWIELIKNFVPNPEQLLAKLKESKKKR
jgi:hypothetical protein